MAKMTHKEHAARAMLMGRVYDWRDRTYCLPNIQGYPSGDDMIDADTLEPVSTEQANTRIHGKLADNWKEFPYGEE